MHKAILKKCKVPAVAAIAALVLTVGSAVAQSQNPIDAIKDAWKKAKDQQTLGKNGQPTTGQPAPGQPMPGQPLGAAQPANAPQARGGTQVNDTGPFTPPVGTKIESVVVAPVEQGSLFGVSPYGVHVATLSHSGSRMVMIYDGVAGPKFDQIFGQGQSTGALGVTFSPDGKRYAYCGRVGSEFIVMADGKEVARSSETQGPQFGIAEASCAIGFTPGSKHVYYTSDVRAGTRFVYDGKASPPGAPNGNAVAAYVFSPDDDHYAYIWSDPTNGSHVQKLIVDGNPAPYFGGEPQWSADSQHLFTKLSSSAAGGVVDVLQDGKPVMRANYVRLYIPPVGNMGIAAVNRNTPPGQFLVIGGKVVPGSEVGPGQLGDVVFSPDGKHYAVRYQVPNRVYIFVDGKKGVDYTGIGNLQAQGVKSTWAAFTADSSKVVYMASTGAGNFLVVGDEETAVPPVGIETVIGPVGSHVAAGGQGVMVLDGKVQKFPGGVPAFLKFSPDGLHFAYALNDRGAIILVRDGVPQSPYGMFSDAPFVFSPDSKHIAYSCRPPNPTGNDDVGVCLDNKYVRTGGPAENLTFTPDSNHIFWVRRLGLKFRLFADGKPVLEGISIATAGFRKQTLQIDPSGALLILSQDATSFKRFSIIPSPETSIASLFGGGR
jgi:hypothetical protein